MKLARLVALLCLVGALWFQRQATVLADACDGSQNCECTEEWYTVWHLTSCDFGNPGGEYDAICDWSCYECTDYQMNDVPQCNDGSTLFCFCGS